MLPPEIGIGWVRVEPAPLEEIVVSTEVTDASVVGNAVPVTDGGCSAMVLEAEETTDESLVGNNAGAPADGAGPTLAVNGVCVSGFVGNASGGLDIPAGIWPPCCACTCCCRVFTISVSA